jgi:GNAT superfamily N-acetyltransferase
MVIVDRYRPEDKAAVTALYHRVRGANAEALLQRWEWQYESNPNLPDGKPVIWLLRLDGEVIGQFATMPVKLVVNGREIDAAWGMDVMITPDHQRGGLGRMLFETWDRNTGASIGLGLTDASAGLFKKLNWGDMGRVPRLIKPFSVRAAGTPTRIVDRVSRAFRRMSARLRPIDGDVRRVRRFDDGVTRLWERVGPRFAFAVRRDAAYLNWKFADAPHLKYVCATSERDGETRGYVVIRHVEQEDLRVTILADFLADPADPAAFLALLRWIDREALAARSDLVRVFTTHAGFQRIFRSAGYLDRDPGMRFVAKVNAFDAPASYYESSADWLVTVGDSDCDR